MKDAIMIDFVAEPQRTGAGRTSADTSGTGAGAGSEARLEGEEQVEGAEVLAGRNEAEAEKVRPWEKMPREVWELLEEMDDDHEIRVAMTMSVMRYLFTGEPDPNASGFKGADRLVYMGMCQHIDRCKAVSELRAKAGKRGGQRRRKTKKVLQEETEAKTNLLENNKAKDEKASRVKSEEGRVKSEEYITDNIHYPLTTTTKKGACENEEKKKFAQSCVDYWNNCVDYYPDTKLRKVLRLTKSRIEKLDVISASYTAKQIQRAFENCMRNDFCNGRGNNERKKPVDFDWVISEDVFIKAYENTI